MTEEQKRIYDYVMAHCKVKVIGSLFSAHITLGYDYQRYGTDPWEAKDTLAKCLCLHDSERVRDLTKLTLPG